MLRRTFLVALLLIASIPVAGVQVAPTITPEPPPLGEAPLGSRQTVMGATLGNEEPRPSRGVPLDKALDETVEHLVEAVEDSLAPFIRESNLGWDPGPFLVPRDDRSFQSAIVGEQQPPKVVIAPADVTSPDAAQPPEHSDEEAEADSLPLVVLEVDPPVDDPTPVPTETTTTPSRNAEAPAAAWNPELHFPIPILFVLFTLFILGIPAIGNAMEAMARRVLQLPGTASMFSRVSGPKTLSHPGRRELLNVVDSSPGICMGDLCKATGLSRTSVGYHLDILERNGLTVSARAGKTRRIYKADSGLPTQHHAMLLNRRFKQIATCIVERPGIIHKSICAAVGLESNRISEALGKLKAAQLVLPEPRGRNVHYFPAASLAHLIQRPTRR